jgi:protein-disulfide isomerase
MSPQPHSISLAVPPEPSDHFLGSEHARVTLVEYGDFECPSCKVAAATPKLLLERFPNKIRFIFRHFPLQEAHPHALGAAEAAEAAAAQGKFWAMHDALFQDQARIKDKDHIYLQKVREHIEGGRRSHIRATPAFFLDGVVQDISFGMKALHDAVAHAVTRVAAARGG